MRNEDKLIITVITIAALFAIYDIGRRIHNSVVQNTAEETKTVSHTSYNKQENERNYRINTHNKLLSEQGLRDYKRYTDNLKYDIDDSINGKLPKKFENDLVVRFTINENGTINCCDVEASSGNKNVDEILVKSISKLNPYKPLPPEHLGEGLAVKLTYGSNDSTGYQAHPVYK